MKPFVFLCLCTLCLFACGSAQKAASSVNSVAEADKQVEPQYRFPYQLDAPDLKMVLPPELNEISGLSMASENEICAIQDENGVLFYLDKNDGKLLRKQNWYKDGDYEGVECVNDKVYVVKSNGKLFELSPSGDTLQRVLYESSLCKKDDIEGLSYDQAGNRLMLACKGKGANPEENAMQCRIFSFCLAEKKVDSLAAFSVELKVVKDYIDQLEEHKDLDKLKEFFSNEEELKFATSAMAIHPITGNLYFTSSRGKILLVMNPEREILHIEKLKKQIHPQPEGLAFDKDGTLFISNETKRENPPLLYKFYYKKADSSR